MEFINENIIDYCLDHSDGESDLLKRITRETHLEVMHPRMLSGHLQGRFLSFVSKLIQPKNILELGTYTGYSALCLAEGLKPGGVLTTIDKNIELEPRVRKYFAESNYSESLRYIVGDAMEKLHEITDGIDLVFIDADKSNYLNYLQLLESKMNKGGVIIADNVLWSGKIIEPIGPKDKDTPALLEFNAYVQNSPKFENVLLPIRDGLMVIRIV